MAEEPDEPIQRWTAKRRVTLVLSIEKGETSVVEAARAHGLTVAEVEAWRERFLVGAENALRSRPKDEEALKDEQIRKLKQKIGDLVVDNDVLREALKPYPRDVRRLGTPGLFSVTGRSGSHAQTLRGQRATTRVSEVFATPLQQLFKQHPTYGYRRLWALLRYGGGLHVNRKAVYRVLRIRQWLVHQRTRTPRPRV